MDLMVKIGITGEMGSGKSRCCEIFESIGVPVFNSDKSAREIMMSNNDVKNQLRSEISNDLYLEDGSLHREILQELLFDKTVGRDNLKKVERIVYPLVGKAFEDFCAAKAAEGCAYVILESAILYESGWFDQFDHVIYVKCPRPERIERVKLRSGLDEEQQNDRTRDMINPLIKERASEFTLFNSDLTTKDDLFAQIEDLDDIIRATT